MHRLRIYDQAEQVLVAARESACEQLDASICFELGALYTRTRRYELARPLFHRALRIARRVEHRMLECHTLLERALMFIDMSRWDRAETDLKEVQSGVCKFA
jgi:uncharacterized protein HemY